MWTLILVWLAAGSDSQSVQTWQRMFVDPQACAVAGAATMKSILERNALDEAEIYCVRDRSEDLQARLRRHFDTSCNPADLISPDDLDMIENRRRMEECLRGEKR